MIYYESIVDVIFLFISNMSRAKTQQWTRSC